MSHDIPHDILSENKEHKKDFHLKDIIIKNRQSKETGNKTKTNSTLCVAHQYTHTSTNNIYKTWALAQTNGRKDEPSIVFMRKS